MNAPTPTNSRDERLRELATKAQREREEMQAHADDATLAAEAQRLRSRRMMQIALQAVVIAEQMKAERDAACEDLAAASPLAALVEELVGALQSATTSLDECAEATWDKRNPDARRLACDAACGIASEAKDKAQAMLDRAAAVTAGRVGG